MWGHRDLWPPRSNSLTLESKWTFVPNLKKFPRAVAETSLSREWDGRMDGRRDGWTGRQSRSIMLLATAVAGMEALKKNNSNSLWVNAIKQKYAKGFSMFYVCCAVYWYKQNLFCHQLSFVFIKRCWLIRHTLGTNTKLNWCHLHSLHADLNARTQDI